MTIGARLRKIREDMGLSAKKFAENIGEKEYKIRDSELGKQKISSDLLEKIGLSYGVNIDWLVTGKESGDSSVSSAGEPGLAYGNNTLSNNNSVGVSLVSLQAGAGDGIYNFETQKTLVSLNPNLFPFVSSGHSTAIEIMGDSMEPELRNGDYIVITPQEPDRNTEDGVYAIRIEGMLKVKSLHFKLDGTIDIISGNTKYPTENYNAETSQVDFQILGRKRLHLSR